MATLMMTTDRLYGVYRPIRRRELIAGACYSNSLVLFVISLAILSGLPKFLMSTTFDIPNANRTVCISEDPAAKGILYPCIIVSIKIHGEFKVEKRYIFKFEKRTVIF